MINFELVVSALILLCVLGLTWQLAPQGARGQRAPIIVLSLFALSFLLVSPVAEPFFTSIRVNFGYLVSHLCALTAVTLTTLYWGHFLSGQEPSRCRVLTTRGVYGSVAVVMVYLFLSSPQEPNGLGFGREFAGNPRMQLYWIIQAILIMHAMSTLAGVAARARARERDWRRRLLSILLGAAVVYSLYEAWVIVIVLVWPAMPPPWAQTLTGTLQVLASLLLLAGTIGPVALGTFRSTRLALNYIEHLAPLHDWLIRHYPQVRFRPQGSRRAETRVIDMLIEVSDALRLLQRDAPALAAANRLDDETIRATAHVGPQHAAYELAAAKLFRDRSPCYPEAESFAPAP